jgi:hypothetical protein
MNGFGTIDNKDINVLISSIENRINFIRNDINQNVTSLKNQLNTCTEELNRLKKLVIQVTNYNDTEYKKLENRINQFANDIEDIKNKLNTIQYNEIAAGKCASGINEYPIYAKYAEKDVNGVDITAYNVSSTLIDKINEEQQRALNAESNLNNSIVSSYNELSETISSNYNSLSSTISSNYETLESDINSNYNSLTALIDNETQRATNIENTLEQKIENEKTRATNKENELSAWFTQQISTLETGETGLLTALNTEIARATSSENALSADIKDETSARNEAINNLTNSLNDEISARQNVDNIINQTINSLSSKYNDDISALSGDLHNEITNRENAITGLEDTINTVSSNLYNTISSTSSTLNTAIGNETTARQSVDETLQQNIDNEVSARILADNDLQSQIDTIEATQNVIDLVASYAALTAYNTSAIKSHDKIQVINDETSGNQSTIYSWENNAWSGMGMFGPYYTKAQVDEEIIKAVSAEKIDREADIEELNTNKQNNLTAGDGIAISNDIISHSIKIIENNNEEDKVVGTTFTVHLKNNHYKIITFDKTITSIKFIIESTTNNVLQETGFEFTCPDESVLEEINFEVKDNPNKKIYTIIPDSYTGLNIYQGTIVNYKCTIGEYEVED